MKAPTYGSGWHKESMRHRNAKLKGKAGGNYRTQYKEMESPTKKKDMTYSQLKRSGTHLKPTKDADKDGVPNSLDCRPLNKHAQDDGVEYVTVETTQPETLSEAKARNNESFFQRSKKAFRELQEEREARHLKELNTGLKKKVENEEEIDTRTLSDSELHRLAIIEGESLIGTNKYESELKRRIKAEADLNTDLKVERQEAAKAQKKRLKEGSGKGFFDGLYD